MMTVIAVDNDDVIMRSCIRSMLHEGSGYTRVN